MGFQARRGECVDVRRCGRLEGKRALVTGAGTGIGREIAIELAREGADVALHCSSSAAGAAAAADEIRSLGRRAEVIQADFIDLVQVRRLAESAIGTLGGLDVLINNAGITANIPMDRVTPEQFDAIYGVNVRAPFFLIQALLPALESAHGAIVNVSSVHGIRGFPQHSVYGGTKGAIIAHTRCMAIELAPRGIRVNAVAPGAVPVESHFRADPTADPDAIGSLIPAGFPGEPIDIARVVAFVVSDDARYILGQTIVVDGGTTAWLAFGTQFREPFTAQFGQGYVPGL